jgi:hypothetical protein
MGAAPRGPHMAAARVPAEAIPARRTAPPAAAARLAPRRIINTADVSARRAPDADLRSRVPEREVRARPPERDLRTHAPEREVRTRAPEREVRTHSPERVRSSEAGRPTSREPERRSVAPAPRARTTAPERLRVEPRSPAPTRLRPPSTSRDSSPVRRVRRP